MIRSDRSKAEAVQVCKPEFLKWLALRRPDSDTMMCQFSSDLVVIFIYIYIYINS